MVAKKRSPQPEVNNAKEKRSGSTEAGSVFQEPLGGFIFVCNNETMDEDFERHLFGLPQRYHDSVKAIQPGLPLFLYNYTTRCLHGVFEASSDGGLNIEPDAWGENKESRKNGRQAVSRFPAQVRVRMREHRPPLEEEKFRPVLYHYDGPKFRLQLSQSEAQELLKLFGASQVRKVVEENPSDTGGEWEKVKTKSKASRNYRAPLTKRSTSPNANGGRRRGSGQNGLNSNGNGNGNGSLPAFSNSMHETISRGRDRENRADTAQRWRSDSDSWSGSSSAGTATSSWGSNEDERPKKSLRENGAALEGNGGVGEGHDCVDGLASRVFAQESGHYEDDSKVEIRFIVDSNESNGSSSSLSAEARAAAAARSGFVSYSAALKSGMLAGAAVEHGFDDGNGSIVPETGNTSQSSVGSASSRTPSSNAAGAGSMPSSSTRANSKGEFPVNRIENTSKQTVESNRPFFQLNIGSYSEAAGSSIQVKTGSQSAVEKGSSESRVEHLSNGGETDGKKAEKTQPWGKPLVVKAVNLVDVVSGQQSGVADNHVSASKGTGDLAPGVQTSGKDTQRNGDADAENRENVLHHRFGDFEGKEIPNKPVETVVRKNVWQGNESAVLRLLHDPDPAVNSGSVNGGTSGHRSESEMYRRKHDRVKSPQPHSQHLNGHPTMERVIYVPSPPLEGQLTQWAEQSSSPSGTVPTHVPHSKGNQHQGLIFQQNRSGHESRRHQYDNQKHDKHMEDRAHFRKQHIHPQEHHQHPTSIMHSQQRQLGQGLMPLRIPTPPPGMQQLHHHAILSPAPLYRDRSRGRSGNGNAESTHGLAYRPINRNMIDGEMGLQSPMGPGGWTVQSPVLLMQPMLTPLNIAGNFTFSLPPPHLLANVEALHAEILEFAQASRPSAETRVHAEQAVECVRDGVKKIWPEADVEVFGSFATGLCLQNSDVDVVVVDAPTPDAPEVSTLSGARLFIPLIRALSASLKEHEWCEAINTIETASMPVIKLRCRPVKANGFSSEPPVAIDVTIGGRRSENFAGLSQATPGKDVNGGKPLNLAFEVARSVHNGAAAREFVIEKLRQLPALAPLVLLMKSFLQQRGLNDVYSGGLGSFALTLMLVFYLERVPISCGVPQDIPPTTPIKSPSSVNLDTNSLSVDTSHATSAVAESVASSDDDSTDSSVLTTTSVSSFASLEVPSVQGSSCGGDEVPSQAGPSTGQLLLRRAGGMVEELLGSMQSVSSPNLGTLLVGFLHVFGHEIDFSRVRLVLKGKNGSPGGLFCHEKMARTLPLWIDDPLRPDAIIGAGSFNIWQVQASMRDMLYAVTRPLSVPGTPVPGTPVDASDRHGNGPGRRRPLPLLDPVFFPYSSPPVP